MAAAVQGKEEFERQIRDLKLIRDTLMHLVKVQQELKKRLPKIELIPLKIFILDEFIKTVPDYEDKLDRRFEKETAEGGRRGGRIYAGRFEHCLIAYLFQIDINSFETELIYEYYNGKNIHIEGREEYYKSVISDYVQKVEPEYEVVFEKKYLKYKKKYLELKNKLNRFK